MSVSKWLLIASASLWMGLGLGAAHADVGQPLESLPIQDAGRIKPFDTFARESLQLVYGKSTFENKPASEVVFTWLLVPDHWMDVQLVEVRHEGLREALKISPTEIRFSPRSLLTNPRIHILVEELQSLRQRQEKLNPYYQAVQRLESQLSLFEAVRSGVALRFVPDPSSDRWKAVSELEGPMRDAFMRLSKGFVDSVAQANGAKDVEPLPEYVTAVQEFTSLARAQAPDKYADSARIGWEEHFNHLHPFMWAWIIYLCGLLTLAMGRLFSLEKKVMPLFWLFLLGALGFHAYGMGLRIYLAGRPPVSNMYETVIWVPFACVLLGLILARVQKSILLLVCSSTVAIFCLILTNLAPTVLDGSIQPLEPVLRSTFWLSTHVLIITLSYAAFFLAFAIGDVVLFYFLKDEHRYAAEIRGGCQSIYRAMQVGIVLLASGTILGGIWADYSWGRFWGWDPKETWAFISLMGYLAVLHGRLIGWVKNFQLAAAAVVTFALVIMSWYGVNFALGAGLHTYGFGAGGVEYVGGFVIAHLLYVAYVSTARYWPSKSKTNG